MKSAPSSRLMRASRLRLNCAVTPGGVVVGAIENFRLLDQVDADHEHRTGAEHCPGMAQEFRRLMRLEIADRRSRKEADARQRRDRRRKVERLREIRDQRMHRKVRKIAAQLRGVLLQEFAGNIDRDIGLDIRRGAEQDARLAARPAAEFDQRTAGRKQRGDGRRMVVQKAKLAARRIIFRQMGDAVEQGGAGGIIKIFRRQPFRLGGEAGDDIGGERSRRPGRLRRAKGGLDVHVTAQRSYSASRRPVNCQRADG